MAHLIPLRYTRNMDVLAIGDTTEDIFMQLHEASLQCNIDGTNCRLCLDYGNKIPVESKKVISGVGNAANHAVGVARLGCKAGIYTILGDDNEGARAREIFTRNGVDTTYVVTDHEHGTNLSIAITFQSERTILVHHEPRNYELPHNLVAPSWIYLTSASGAGCEQLHEQVHGFLEKNSSVRLAFNPGTYQMHLGKEKLMPLLKRTTLLFLNREEAARVLEVETRDIGELVRGLHALGITTVIITDGPEGSYVSDGSTVYQFGTYPEEEVERTGAGDAFGSGFLSAIIQGKSIPEAMQWGTANATSVVRYVGAREGLLEQRAILHMIEEYKDMKPTEFLTL